MGKVLEIYPWLKIPDYELEFRFTRSSGPGGQNVNKVSTRVELLFDLAGSPSLDDRIRHRLQRNLAGMVGKDGVLHLASQESRSQWKNRVDVVERFTDLLKRALVPRHRRIATGPTTASRRRRARQKRARAATKASRRRVPNEE